jgi:uncharacterized phiE125 gp8 family phage protein
MTLCPLRMEVSALDTSPLPLDLTLVKDHVAVDGDDLDTLLERYTLAAVRWAEGSTRRTIYRRSHRWVLSDFPRVGRLEIFLPRGKTISVESVAYTDTSGTVQTLTGPSSGSPGGTDYQEDLQGDDGGMLRPIRGEVWPAVDTDAVSPVVITFTAGYAADEVPDDLIHAMLFAVSDMFDTRGSADLTVFGRNFETRELLASGYRLNRWY